MWKKARTEHPSPGDDTSSAAATSTLSDHDKRPARTRSSTVVWDSVTDVTCAPVDEKNAATASNKTPSDSDSPAEPGVSENVSTRNKLVRVETVKKWGLSHLGFSGDKSCDDRVDQVWCTICRECPTAAQSRPHTPRFFFF